MGAAQGVFRYLQWNAFTVHNDDAVVVGGEEVVFPSLAGVVFYLVQSP